MVLGHTNMMVKNKPTTNMMGTCLLFHRCSKSTEKVGWVRVKV